MSIITRDDIKALTTFSRVAFAVRCARRLQSLFRLPAELAADHHSSVIEKMLELASEFAQGHKWKDGEITGKAKDSSIVYSEMARAAKDLSIKSLPRATPFYDYRALAKAYEVASDYLAFAVAAVEMEEISHPEYQDDSAYVDYETCAHWWRLQPFATDAANSDLRWLVENTEADESDYLPNAVDSDFFELPLWPKGNPNWSELMERHRLVVFSLGEKIIAARKTLEILDGFVERIDGDIAYVVLTSQTGETLCGRYDANDLAAKGIAERRRFRCTTFDVGGTVDVLLESVPDKQLSAEQESEIRRRIDKTLGGEDLDEDESHGNS
jgi:hypothetical protein